MNKLKNAPTAKNSNQAQMKKLTFLTILVAIFFSSCKKEELELPTINVESLSLTLDAGVYTASMHGNIYYYDEHGRGQLFSVFFDERRQHIIINNVDWSKSIKIEMDHMGSFGKEGYTIDRGNFTLRRGDVLVDSREISYGRFGYTYSNGK